MNIFTPHICINLLSVLSMESKSPFYGLFKWLFLIVFINVGNYVCLSNIYQCKVLNVSKSPPSHPIRISVYQHCYVKFNLTNNFINHYWIIFIIGIIFWLILLLVSINLAKKMRFVRFSTNLNIMPNRCKKSTDWIRPLKIITILLLYVFIIDPWIILFTPTEELTIFLLNNMNFGFFYYLTKTPYYIMSSLRNFLHRCMYNMPILILYINTQGFPSNICFKLQCTVLSKDFNEK